MDRKGPGADARIVLLGAAFVGPCVSSVDGFHSSVLWAAVVEDIPLAFAAAAVVGLLAGPSRLRFARILAVRPSRPHRQRQAMPVRSGGIGWATKTQKSLSTGGLTRFAIFL